MTKKSFISYTLIVGIILMNSFAYGENITRKDIYPVENTQKLKAIVADYNAQFDYINGDEIVGYNKQTKTNEIVNIKKLRDALVKNAYLPLDKEFISYSSTFGRRGSLLSQDAKVESIAMHTGLDISAANINNQNVYSILDGKIEKIQFSNTGYGNLVVVDHGNFRTYYAHLSSIENMQEGDLVKGGQLIGKVGSTGRSTGPHLHLEINIGYIAVNPEAFMPYIEGSGKVLVENKPQGKKEAVVEKDLKEKTSKPVEKVQVKKKEEKKEEAYELILEPAIVKPEEKAYDFKFSSETEAYPFDFEKEKQAYSFEFDFQ